MYGSWLYIAIANFALIAVALVWGLTAQLSPKIKTFEDKRADIFEEYTHRQFKTLIGFNEGKRDPRRSALRDTFLKPFNSQDAFFFPSAFLIASFLSFLSFIYVLMQSIQVLNNTEKLLQQILNTAVDRSVLFVSSINNAYFQALGADLPDSHLDLQLSHYTSRRLDKVAATISLCRVICYVIFLCHVKLLALNLEEAIVRFACATQNAALYFKM